MINTTVARSAVLVLVAAFPSLVWALVGAGRPTMAAAGVMLALSPVVTWLQVGTRSFGGHALALVVVPEDEEAVAQGGLGGADPVVQLVGRGGGVALGE